MSPERLRASARSLEGFAQERDWNVTPELREAIGEYRRQADAITAYEKRPLRCKLGLHSRRQSWTGSSYWGACVICHRDELPAFYEYKKQH